MFSISPITTLPFQHAPMEVSKAADRERLALQQLEQLFVSMLLKEMRRSVPEDGLIPKSSAMKTYEEMLDDVLSQRMAEAGQFGIAKMMSEQLRIHEVQSEVRRQIRELDPQNRESKGLKS